MNKFLGLYRHVKQLSHPYIKLRTTVLNISQKDNHLIFSFTGREHWNDGHILVFERELLSRIVNSPNNNSLKNYCYLKGNLLVNEAVSELPPRPPQYNAQVFEDKVDKLIRYRYLDYQGKSSVGDYLSPRETETQEWERLS